MNNQNIRMMKFLSQKVNGALNLEHVPRFGMTSLIDYSGLNKQLSHMGAQNLQHVPRFGKTSLIVDSDLNKQLSQMADN